MSGTSFIHDMHFGYSWVFGEPVLRALATLRPDVEQRVWFHPSGDAERKDALIRAGAAKVGPPAPGDVENAALYWTSEFGWGDFVPPLSLPRVQIFHNTAVHKGFFFTRVQRVFSHFFLGGPIAREYFEKLVRPIHPDAIALEIGYPKIDPLLQGSYDREAIRASWKFAEAAPIVLYAPTHGVTTVDFAMAGSVDIAGPAILDTLLDMGLNVVFRSHPWNNYIDYRPLYSRFRKHPRFRWEQDDDANRQLAAADLLVADCGGIVWEAAACDLPTVLYDIPDYFRRNRRFDSPPEGDPEDWIRPRLADVVPDIDALREAVDANLRDPGRRRADRRLWRDRLYYNPGSAASAAAAALLEIGGLAR